MARGRENAIYRAALWNHESEGLDAPEPTRSHCISFNDDKLCTEQIASGEMKKNEGWQDFSRFSGTHRIPCQCRLNRGGRGFPHSLFVSDVQDSSRAFHSRCI